MKKVLAAVLAGVFMVNAIMPVFAEEADVAVIIKATDSEFWQYVLVGAKNYAKENPGKVKITTYGPKAEAEVDKQVAILEDVISRNPKAIVIASTNSDATVPALEDAHDKGIKIITIDNKVNTDKVHSFLATNNLKAGALAADEMLAQMKAANIQPKGKVAVINAVAGAQVLIDRQEGFLQRIKEIAPEITVLEPRYCDNDIIKALGIANDLYTANPDLIGFFGCNNHSGDGVARAIAELDIQDKVIAIAFDSDPEEVEALKSGALKGLILQDPYGMGYKGVDFALKSLAGEKIPAVVDTGATAVTKATMDQPAMQELLNPLSRAK